MEKAGLCKRIIKTNVVEDIEYLDNEISGGNPYISRANAAPN